MGELATHTGCPPSGGAQGLSAVAGTAIIRAMAATHVMEPCAEAEMPGADRRPTGGESEPQRSQCPGCPDCPGCPGCRDWRDRAVLLSVVVPVLHEAHRIAELVGHVRALAAELPPATVELVVADGAPEGDTLTALQTARGKDARRAAVAMPGKDVTGTDLSVRAVAAPRGRARQMNAGAAVARGRVLLFLHADTRLPAGAFPAVLRALGVSPHVAGDNDSDAAAAPVAAGSPPDAHGEAVIGRGESFVPRDGDRIPRAGAFALSIDASGVWFRVVEALANLRNRLTRTPYGDQAQFFQAGLFRAMGGYPDQPLMEDVEIMRRLRRQHYPGQPLTLLDLRAVTSARRWRDEGAVRCTLRNICLRLLYALGVPAQILARWYRARKGAS